jgi:hypothetical protein
LRYGGGADGKRKGGKKRLNRRIIENPGTATDLYYSKDWQVLEERQGPTVTAQNVWSPVYVDVDAMVLCDGSRDWRIRQP